MTQMHLARDCNQVINQWRVETDSKQYEVSVFLAPLFEPSAGDAANPVPFLAAEPHARDCRPAAHVSLVGRR